MDPSLWIAFAGAAAALLVLPGPDWAFMIAVGARRGQLAPAVTGLTIGYVVLTLVVAAGLGPLVAASPTLLGAVTVAGAAYLVHLGTRILRAPRPSPDLRPEGASGTAGGRAAGRRSLVRRGVVVSSSNAKALILFVAFLPQFITPAAPWPLAAQLACLGLTWAALGAAFYTLLGASAHTLLTGRAALAQAVTRVAGAAMTLMGLLLVGQQVLGLATGDPAPGGGA